MRISLIIMAAAALALVLSACAEGPVGIFASIAAETDINKHATKEFRGTSPSFVAKLDDTYYAGIGGLWKRGVAETSWTKQSTAFLGSGNFSAVSGAVNGGALFILYVEADNNSRGVYKFESGTWDSTPISITGISPSEQPTSLLQAETGALFLVTSTQAKDSDGKITTTSSLYRFDGTNFVKETGAQNKPAPGVFNAIAINESTCYFSAGTHVYAGTSGSISLITGESNQPSDVNFGGVSIVGTNPVFMGRDGKLYRREGTNWTNSIQYSSFNGRPFSFSIPVVVDDGVNSTLLVPSRAYEKDTGLGYLEFDASSFTASTAPNSSYGRVSTLNNYFITLDGKSVKQILAFDENGDATHERLFALTDGDGLWSNQWQGSSWSGWRRE